MKIISHFAILNVKRGHEKLLKAVEKNTPIPVTIIGFINGIYNCTDGISQEFEIDVHSVVSGKQMRETKP